MFHGCCFFTFLKPTTVEKIESRVGYKVRKQMGVEQNIYMDKEAQIRAIEKTFEDSKEDITEHHTEKGVYPVEVLPILPDDDMWKFPCAQVRMEDTPKTQSKSCKKSCIFVIPSRAATNRR